MSLSFRAAQYEDIIVIEIYDCIGFYIWDVVISLCGTHVPGFMPPTDCVILAIL